jgi:Toprim-like/CHC2 zinc finger
MNIHDANTIAIPEILTKLAIQPHRITNNKAWYLSPFRQEKTPSFQVDLNTNRWYDFGEGTGGDVVDLVCTYLKLHKEESTTTDALRWIKNMSDKGLERFDYPIANHEFDEEEYALVQKSSKVIKHLGLINYLEKRGIPLKIAQKHLKEIHVYNKNTNKKFLALGFPNEENGYELRNPFFKGCLRSKAISFVRGEIPKPKSIAIFEGFMDYLSILSRINGKPFKGDTIILNSLSCLKQVYPYIRDYGYEVAYTWMDNDRAGEDATAMLADFFKSQEGITHKPMNNVYVPHKDVNAWHMAQLNLSL